MELEDIYSENDKYLIEEYLRNGTDDFYLADLGMGEALFVVPYNYVKTSRNSEEAIDRFKTDLLSFQDEERKKYFEAGKKVRGYRLDDEFYVIPLSHEEKISSKVLRTKVLSKAKSSYDEVINMYRELREASDEDVLVSFVGKDKKKAKSRLEELRESKEPVEQSSIVDNAKWDALMDRVSDLAELSAEKIADFTERVVDTVKFDKTKRDAFLSKLAGVVGKSKDKCKQIKENLSERVAEEFDRVVELKDRVGDVLTRRGNAIIVAGLLGSMVIGSVALSDRETAESDGFATENVEKVYDPSKYILGHTNENGDYVDFRGVVHKDTYGNIKRINELRPELSALLIAVEGLAEDAYRDGKGIPTIGSGSTTHINNDGSEIDVKMGDEMSPEQAMINKWKFVEMYLLDLCGDDVGRSLSDKDIYCGIGGGFCWGPYGLKMSEMYGAIVNNEGEEAIMVKSTLMRKQRGLLKRTFFFMNCDKAFEQSCDDFLNLPVYLNSSGEYIHSAVYDLRLRDIMPCEQDENGKYLKNGKNDVPVEIPGHDPQYCVGYYNDQFCNILSNLVQKGEKSLLPSAKLKDLMPEDMVSYLQYKYKNSHVNFKTIDFYNAEQGFSR